MLLITVLKRDIGSLFKNRRLTFLPSDKFSSNFVGRLINEMVEPSDDIT